MATRAARRSTERSSPICPRIHSGNPLSGPDGSICTADTCDAGGACLHAPANAGSECRPAAGVCDVAEKCDGVNASCPADALQPDGTGCSDGAFCNGQETTCQSGVCQAGASPCPFICDEETDQCLADCPEAPLTCRSAERSLLLVKNSDPTTSKKLTWKLIKGEATSQAEFGDPTAATDYAFCIYAGTPATLVGEAIVPADPNKWSPISSNGYRYKDRASSGIGRILLKGSAENKSKGLVKGRGDDLPDLALPATSSLTVQLVNGTNGLCWGTDYTPAQLVKNGAEQLKAKAP